MKIERFEDLPIWKDARALSRAIYEISRSFKDFSLRDQMRRAAVSVVSNIAEGFERGSNKEFLQFLYVAKGSVGELRAQLYVALDEKWLMRGISATVSRNAREFLKESACSRII